MRFQTLAEWLRWQEASHPKAIDLGLDRVRQVFEGLQPQYRKPFTITVAGTNGKGSCIAFLETILRCQGYRVGSYSSPHLVRYNERIRVDGEPVDDRAICAVFDRIDRVRGDISLSYFEFGTLAALDIFSRRNLDVQLLEVGLGGRLDAVNVVDPDVALISSIAIDHTDWLGSSRQAIGREKAGILRPNTPAILGDPDPPASLLEAAQRREAGVHRLGVDFDYLQTDRVWCWRGPLGKRIEDLPLPGLVGPHQFQNASAVLAALAAVAERLPVSQRSMAMGVASARLAGRFQVVDGPVPLVLDVAHNPEAAASLAENLRLQYPSRRVRALFSLMGDKDLQGVVMNLKPVVDHWYLVPLDRPRAAAEAELAGGLAACGVRAFSQGFRDFRHALGVARSEARPGEVLLIFGSFFLVSEFFAGEH